MATFCYVHPATNAVIEKDFPCGKAPKSVVVRGVRCQRCVAVELAGQNGIRPSTWPMISRALAVHPSQRGEYAEFANKHNVPTEFDSAGHPVFRSREHRRKYCELVGATDFDGGYGDPVARQMEI